MFIKLHSDQVDDLIVKELTETYAKYDEGWFDDNEEMQESIAHVLTHFMTPDEHVAWKKSVERRLEKECEWVGLTNREIQEITDRIKVDELSVHKSTWHIRFAQAVQRKLKEKNT